MEAKTSSSVPFADEMRSVGGGLRSVVHLQSAAVMFSVWQAGKAVPSSATKVPPWSCAHEPVSNGSDEFIYENRRFSKTSMHIPSLTRTHTPIAVRAHEDASNGGARHGAN